MESAIVPEPEVAQLVVPLASPIQFVAELLGLLELLEPLVLLEPLPMLRTQVRLETVFAGAEGEGVTVLVLLLDGALRMKIKTMVTTAMRRMATAMMTMRRKLLGFFCAAEALGDCDERGASGVGIVAAR